MELLQRELQRSRRSHESGGVTIVLADIDHFKNVNDTYGHTAGDTALRKVAKTLLASVRDYDAVSRYGGEEFLAILPGCEAKIGCERAEHIRHAIEIEKVESSEAKISLTLSMGVANSAEWPGLDAEVLVRKADEALYQGKSEGRNRVVIARPEGFDRLRPSEQLVIV